MGAKTSHLVLSHNCNTNFRLSLCSAAAWSSPLPLSMVEKHHPSFWLYEEISLCPTHVCLQSKISQNIGFSPSDGCCKLGWGKEDWGRSPWVLTSPSPWAGLLLQEMTMAGLHELRFTEEKPLLRGQDTELVSLVAALALALAPARGVPGWGA